MTVSDCEPELREAFHVFDSDNTGFISTASLREMISALAHHLTEEEVDEVVRLTDRENRGKVSFDTFASLMMMHQVGNGE
jgi:calmodulin